MTDNRSKEDRTKNMRAIRSVSRLEDHVSKSLWSSGIRFRRNVKDLLGRPDFSIRKYKIVIFIDSCFWHGCSLHLTNPKTNLEYWERKLERNRKRDIAVTEFYKSNDWHIFRVWEHELKKENFNRTVHKLIDSITEIKQSHN